MTVMDGSGRVAPTSLEATYPGRDTEAPSNASVSPGEHPSQGDRARQLAIRIRAIADQLRPRADTVVLAEELLHVADEVGRL